jgi:hypothetical protein
LSSTQTERCVGQVRVEWPWRSGAKRCKGRSFESRMLGEVHGISFRGRRLILRTSSSGLRRIGDEYVPVHRARTAADNRSQDFGPRASRYVRAKFCVQGTASELHFLAASHFLPCGPTRCVLALFIGYSTTRTARGSQAHRLGTLRVLLVVRFAARHAF